jgi:CRISPR-associated protein Cas1
MIQNFETNLLQGEILQSQISAKEPLKKSLWKQTVESKIKNQAALLNKLGKNGNKLRPYYNNVKSGDIDNREGIAARLYFQELFGKNFVRDRFDSGINSLLNYGYTIIRSASARAIMSAGLFPAFGIFHHNRSNAFPLADDLMEPYRPFVDEIVFGLTKDNTLELNRITKEELIRVLFCDTYFPKVTRPLEVALSYTMASVARCFNKGQKSINYPTLK